MKAIVYSRYGPPEVLQLKEVEKPTPGDKQLLVKVHAASINAMDYRRFERQSFIGRFMDERLTKAVNTILGADVAGTVEGVGSSVTEFKPGDDVFGVAPGAFAEYVCNGAGKFALKPVNASFEEAAAVPVAAFTALQGLRNKGKIQAGQKVAISGASGGVGMFAVQIAKSFGTEVTAVCSTRNLEMARSIGADHVIDYMREDFTKTRQRYDLILAVNGSHPILHYRRVLNAGGTCVIAGGAIPQVLQAILLGPLISRIGNRKIGFMGIATTPREDLLTIKDLLEARKIAPVIDRQYPLSDTAEAFRYLVNEHASGKVVITVS